MNSLITCNNVLLPQVDEGTKTNFGYHVLTRKTSSFHRLASHNYTGAGKSLARPGRKQANVSVRMA